MRVEHDRATDTDQDSSPGLVGDVGSEYLVSVFWN